MFLCSRTYFCNRTSFQSLENINQKFYIYIFKQARKVETRKNNILHHHHHFRNILKAFYLKVYAYTCLSPLTETEKWNPNYILEGKGEKKASVSTFHSRSTELTFCNINPCHFKKSVAPKQTWILAYISSLVKVMWENVSSKLVDKLNEFSNIPVEN